LRANLRWCVEKHVSSIRSFFEQILMLRQDGSLVPNDQVKGLTVVVQDVIVTPAKDITEFPTYGEKTLHPEVTA